MDSYVQFSNNNQTSLKQIKRHDRVLYAYQVFSSLVEVLCSPMLLSTFSHFSLFHMAANMYVLWSFSSSIVNILGQEQFVAVYLSAGNSFTLRMEDAQDSVPAEGMRVDRIDRKSVE